MSSHRRHARPPDVVSVHAALHPQARQLVESGPDRRGQPGRCVGDGAWPSADRQGDGVAIGQGLQYGVPRVPVGSLRPSATNKRQRLASQLEPVQPRLRRDADPVLHRPAVSRIEGLGESLVTERLGGRSEPYRLPVGRSLCLVATAVPSHAHRGWQNPSRKNATAWAPIVSQQRSAWRRSRSSDRKPHSAPRFDASPDTREQRWPSSRPPASSLDSCTGCCAMARTTWTSARKPTKNGSRLVASPHSPRPQSPSDSPSPRRAPPRKFQVSGSLLVRPSACRRFVGLEHVANHRAANCQERADDTRLR